MGSPTGLPFASRQGELNVGSVTPKREILQQPRLLQIGSDLQVVPAGVDGNIGLRAPVQQLPGLVLGGRRIGERIAAAVVEKFVLANVWIDRQQDVRVEGVLVARSDTPGEHAMPLILRQLVVVVGDLDPIARGEEIEMEDVVAARLEV